MPPRHRSDAGGDTDVPVTGPGLTDEAVAAELASSVRKLRLYRIVSRLYFHLSVLFVLFATAGLGTLAIETVLAVYGLCIMLAGPISRRLLARVGPVSTLVVGESMKAVGLVLIALSPGTVALAFAGQALNGLGFGLTSTADPVVVNAVFEGHPEGIGKFQATAQSLMFLTALVAGVIGAFMFLWEPDSPLWFAAAATAVAVLVASRLPRGSGPAKISAPTTRWRSLDPRQVRAVGYYVLTRGFMLAAFVGLLPFLLYERLALGIVPLAGALAAFSLAAFVTARYSQKLLGLAGPTRLMVTSVVLLAAAFVVFAYTDDVTITVVAMTITGAASGVVRPVTMRRLSQISKDSPERPGLGPVAGLMERAFGIANAAVIVLGGVLITSLSFRTGMLLLAAILVVSEAAVLALARGGTDR